MDSVCPSQDEIRRDRIKISDLKVDQNLQPLTSPRWLPSYTNVHAKSNVPLEGNKGQTNCYLVPTSSNNIQHIQGCKSSSHNCHDSAEAKCRNVDQKVTGSNPCRRGSFRVKQRISLRTISHELTLRLTCGLAYIKAQDVLQPLVEYKQ